MENSAHSLRETIRICIESAKLATDFAKSICSQSVYLHHCEIDKDIQEMLLEMPCQSICEMSGNPLTSVTPRLDQLGKVGNPLAPSSVTPCRAVVSYTPSQINHVLDHLLSAVPRLQLLHILDFREALAWRLFGAKEPLPEQLCDPLLVAEYSFKHARTDNEHISVHAGVYNWTPAMRRLADVVEYGQKLEKEALDRLFETMTEAQKDKISLYLVRKQERKAAKTLKELERAEKKMRKTVKVDADVEGPNFVRKQKAARTPNPLVREAHARKQLEAERIAQEKAVKKALKAEIQQQKEASALRYAEYIAACRARNREIQLLRDNVQQFKLEKKKEKIAALQFILGVREECPKKAEEYRLMLESRMMMWDGRISEATKELRLCMEAPTPVPPCK